uniref:Uncharacterized protein n=1 Tax=Nelumbo nucifera TaxID=4432 RepID=A0A822ZJ13_NELNU|nr:TPA_asm: hypothetical protein HUJ06_016021 [Nelumbo nucifera]
MVIKEKNFTKIKESTKESDQRSSKGRKNENNTLFLQDSSLQSLHQTLKARFRPLELGLHHTNRDSDKETIIPKLKEKKLYFYERSSPS